MSENELKDYLDGDKPDSLPSEIDDLLEKSVMDNYAEELAEALVFIGEQSNSGSDIPSGLISMWEGEISDIPEGWALCDGNNDTPDLTDKFVVGAGGKHDVEDEGGKDETTYSISDTDTVEIEDSISGTHPIVMAGSGHIPDDSSFGLHDMHNSLKYEIPNESKFNDNITTEIRPTSDYTTEGYYSDYLFKTEIDGDVSASETVEISGNDTQTNKPPYYALAYIMKL